MRNLVRIIAFFLIFAISVGAEAGKRSGGFGGHGWGKSSHSSHIKLKKKNTKKKFIAGVVGAGAASSAADTDNSNETNTSKIIAKEANWANHALLDDHFERHGKDFNAIDSRDYAKKANHFYERSKTQKIRKKVDSNGVIRLWDPNTNEFGSFTNKGKTKTYYKPKSPSYWDKQEGVEINE
jgi:pyocin large subunit-like protein